MSDDFAEPTLLRRNSSTTYKEAFEVIKPYHNNLPGGYLTLNKGDIVIVETDCSVAGSSLRYGYKVPYNHQNGRGWFDESYLKKCNIPIEELTGPRYLFSSTPLRSTIDLSTSSASITIPHGNGNGGGGEGGGMAGMLKEVLDNNTEKLLTMIKKISRKATNITFTRVGREGKSLSLMASDVAKCENGKSLITTANKVDADGLLEYTDKEYDSMFIQETHALRFNFVDFNASLLLDRFKTTSTDDILMGKKTTVIIEMSIVELPKVASAGTNKRRIEW